jgi:hypothetical protein
VLVLAEVDYVKVGFPVHLVATDQPLGFQLVQELTDVLEGDLIV